MRLSTRELQALRSIIGELELACDTRVDLLIQNPGQPLPPIHQIAMEQGVLL